MDGDDANKCLVDDLSSEFLNVYKVLKAELLEDPSFEFAENSRQWVDTMLDYHVLRGKGKRTKELLVVECYQFLKERKEMTQDELFLASVLGWCVEWLHAYCLALKDVTRDTNFECIDGRRPSCFTVPKDGIMVNANDGLFLRNHIPRILKKHFREKPYYADLIDLFHEIEFKTSSGLMLDFVTTRKGRKDISTYLMPLYIRIVQYKTSYHSFYISTACALLMSGEKLEDHVEILNILVNMGIHSQAQDDYLDCYGEPSNVRRKVRTAIEDFRCTWLVVTALEKCNKEQKKLLSDHYGKEDEVDIAKVKELYNELDLQASFAKYEAETYKNLMASIESHSSNAIQALLKSLLCKIQKKLI